MTNWCMTRIQIRHEDKNKLAEFKEIIENCTKQNLAENGFGPKWLGNIVLHEGLGTISENISTDVKCRGSLVDMYLDAADGLIVDTETAWLPCLNLWSKLLEKYLPDAELIYIADEPGCDLFITNDPDYVDKYYLDVFEDVNGLESNWEIPEVELISLLKELLQSECDSLDELMELLDDSDYGECIRIHKWEYACAEDYD